VRGGPASITIATWIQLRLQILRLILIYARRWLLGGVLGFGVNLAERKGVTVCTKLASGRKITVFEDRV
jgi:hypothetical protein